MLPTIDMNRISSKRGKQTKKYLKKLCVVGIFIISVLNSKLLMETLLFIVYKSSKAVSVYFQKFPEEATAGPRVDQLLGDGGAR